MAGEVEVIKAVEGGTRRRNMVGNGFSIERKRVAAYVRVSTDAEEQLQSFQSQKLYYQEKISKNKEWVMSFSQNLSPDFPGIWWIPFNTSVCSRIKGLRLFLRKKILTRFRWKARWHWHYFPPLHRKKYSRKFAFSSMCECGFCGKYLTRRSHNQTTTQTKLVWKCRTATNFGIENCPHSKSIDEAIIENAFLEMFHLLADNFDDVLESVIRSVEETLSNDESAVKLQSVEKTIRTLESKRKKLNDMLLDDKITKEAYDAKYNELARKINQAKGERSLYSSNVEAQKHVSQRMREIRACIAEADMLDKFDRVVFESIVEKVIVGDMNEDGTVDPYKLTFVRKGMDDRIVPDAKRRYKNLNKKVG